MVRAFACFRTATRYVRHLKMNRFTIRDFWATLGIACMLMGAVLFAILLR